MTHQCNFELDLDGQITCSICGGKLMMKVLDTVTECYICGYNSKECDIVNNLCSVHTCEICGSEGFAYGDEGKILCDTHEVELFI